MKKIVLLDLGGVVFQSTGVSNDKINWEIITLLNDEYAYALNIGEDKFPDFLQAYNRLSKQALSGSEFLKLVFDTLSFNQELIDLLQADDYHIIIVSDNYRENIQYIAQRYHFAAWSEQQFYSYDFKMEKSNPLFFKRLLAELNLTGEALLFIDDSEYKLASARQHNIKGILYKNNQALSEALKKVHP